MRMAGHPTPSVRDLVSGNEVDFDMLESNGDWFFRNMIADIKSQRQQIQAHDYQK